MHTPGRLGQGEAVLRHPLPLPGLDKERADESVLATTDGEAAGGPESEGGLSDEVLRLPLCFCCTCSLHRFNVFLLHTPPSSSFHYVLVIHTSIFIVSMCSCYTHLHLHLQQGNANQSSTSFLNQAEPHPFPILQDASIRFPRGTVLLRAFAGVPVFPRQKQEDSHSVYLCK